MAIVIVLSTIPVIVSMLLINKTLEIFLEEILRAIRDLKK